MQTTTKFSELAAMNRSLRYLLLATFMLLVQAASAQTEPESATLVIASPQGGKEHTLHPGDRLNYQKKGGEMVRKGRIESVQDSSLTVAGNEVAFSELQTIVHVKGHRKVRGAGLLKTSLIGLLVSSLLFLIVFALAGGRTTSGERGLMLFFGVLAFVLFPLLMLIALLVLLMGRSKFVLGNRWQLRKG